MPQISTRVTDNGVYQGLQKVSDGLPNMTQEQLDAAMDEAKYEVSGGWNGGNNYAVDERPGQTYERTGNLGASTYWERIGLTYAMYSDAYHDGKAYSKYVVGMADGSGQAWMHAGRWPNFADTMAKWADIIIQRAKDGLDMLIGSAFGT